MLCQFSSPPPPSPPLLPSYLGCQFLPFHYMRSVRQSSQAASVCVGVEVLTPNIYHCMLLPCKHLPAV